MNRTSRLALSIFLCFSFCSWAAPKTGMVVGTNKYTAEVDKFASEPIPPPRGVLLVGSSIFKRWTNAVSDLAPLPVTNRAFGGSQTSHQLMFFDQVVSPCRPRLIVWYCGSNDIKGKKDPQSVLKRTEEWLDKVKKLDPSTQVLLVSIHRCPQKRKDGQLEGVDAVNRGYEELSQRTEGVFYVDVNPSLESVTGKSKAELYLEDGLHLNPSGYEKMATLVKPAIQSHWKPK
jgi:lysophospholipase L1-like esterase